MAKKEVDIFDDPDAVPKSDWFKFTNPGDSVTGVLTEVQYDVASKFGTQTVYTLETPEGDIVLVSLNPKTAVRAARQMKQAEIGDVVGFKFTEWYDSGKGNQGKNIEVRIRQAQPSEAAKNAKDAGLV